MILEGCKVKIQVQGETSEEEILMKNASVTMGLVALALLLASGAKA
jgi:hypothetical protein